jgi:RsiW-degrading membrane proteinase PrsW (M82 family)
MTITNLIIAWLFVMAAYLLWWKYREDRLRGRSFFNFGDYNFLIASITALTVMWSLLTIFSPEPNFSDPDKQIEFGNKTRQPWLVTNALWNKIEKDPRNPDYNFELLRNHFIQEQEHFLLPDKKAFEKEGDRIFNYYTDLTEKENDDSLNDIGNLFLTDWYLNKLSSDPEPSSFYLRQVKNRSLKYVNYIQGEILLYHAGPQAAEPAYQDEIKFNGYKNGAYEGLANVYNLSGRTDELRKLIYDEKSRTAVPVDLRYKVYFLSGDLLSFYELRFEKMFGTLPLWGILGDLLILFMWLFFLRQLSFLSPIKWKHFFLAVGTGALLAMFSWLLYEFYHHVLHFWSNGNVGNDLLFSFLGIGFIEELVKLIPFLIILHFTNIIKKPVDYLLIASAAGLGFAFFENLLYISQYGLDVIHSRALTASVSHMASSAIVAYGFVLLKFRYPKRYWLIPVFFIAAVLAHGFYDFWLLNDKVHSLAIVTLFFFLSEMLVYVSFLNNSLNQSAVGISKMSALALNTQRLSGFLAGAFLLVFVLEYTGTCFVYGTTIGNQTLANAFFSGGYLIFFLSVRLSNIDIIPGEWMPIEFFSGILPSEILGGSKKLNQNSVVGLQLQFLISEFSSEISGQLPLTGIVTRRLTIGGFTGWFELELETPVSWNEKVIRTMYIRAKIPTELITKDEETTVGLFYKSEEEEKTNLVFMDWANAK